MSKAEKVAGVQPEMETVEIDGSMLEGGGQILRISAGMGCLLRKTIVVHSIRAKRSKPGLRAQHLTGLQLVTQISRGTLLGGAVGSCDIKLQPGQLQGGHYEADTGTAGSIALLIQVTLPCMIFTPRPSHLRLRGGTNADMAPPVDFLQHVFCPIAERFGVSCDIDVIKRGFFPQGGGIVEVACKPSAELKAVEMLDPGHLVEITGQAVSAGDLPPNFADDIAKDCQRRLNSRHKELVDGVRIAIAADHLSPHKAKATGSSVLIVGHTSTGCLLAGTGLGSKHKGSRAIAADAVDMLTNNLQHAACVDEHLQDQLIILMSLAKGVSRIRTGPLTMHTETAMELCKQILGVKFEVTAVEGVPGVHIITCEGVGFTTATAGDISKDTSQQSTFPVPPRLRQTHVPLHLVTT